MTRYELTAALRTYCIPLYMWDGIIRYVCDHVPTGSFLKAVFSNDLYAAALHADDTNARALYRYARLVDEKLPRECHGSAAKVRAWVAKETAISTKTESRI